MQVQGLEISGHQLAPEAPSPSLGSPTVRVVNPSDPSDALSGSVTAMRAGDGTTGGTTQGGAWYGGGLAVLTVDLPAVPAGGGWPLEIFVPGGTDGSGDRALAS